MVERREILNTVNPVVVGSVLDQRSTAIVKLFAQSLIESVVNAANPITQTLGNIFNYSFGAARNNFASMMVPALLVGSMSSDAIGHQASGINRGNSMVEQYQDLENQQSNLAKQAQDLNDHLADKKPDKRKAPTPLNTETNANAIKSNRKILKSTRKEARKLERKAQKAANKVKDLERLSPLAKGKIKHLKHDLQMAQVRYDAQPDSANQAALNDAQRRFALSKEIITQNKSISKAGLEKMDQDLQKILDAERSAEHYRKQAQSRWFSRGANADRNRADEYDQSVLTTLNKYGVNKASV